ncbi:MAG: excinuclease ABC subunit UvrC [Oscillospiraceae bacterium]
MISILNKNIEYLKEKTSKLTSSPGVYLMKDINGDIIYIGKAKNLKNRVSSYFRDSSNHNAKTIKMISKIHDYDFIVTDTELECLILECSLIKQHQPKYNILLKDGKGYSYIKISNEEYPRITAEHHKNDNSKYIGIYTSSAIARHTVDEVNNVFKLPTCKKIFPRDLKKQRPCLNYHIGKCMGVCLGNISKSEYNNIISDAIDYIKTGSEKSIEKLTQQMEEASQSLDFEKAIVLRNRIDYIKKSSQPQKIKDVISGNADFIGKVTGTDCTSISVLKYRSGRLFDKENFFINDTSIFEESVLESFIIQYYTNKDFSELPETIFIDEPLESIEDLSKLIKSKLVYRQRGDNAKFLSMAKDNASEYLSIKEDRTSKEVKSLEKLSKILGLKSIPNRIEAYDISNIGSSTMVGSMVVFENGRPNKRLYRKFSIDGFFTPNDYACMENILTRRLSYLVDSSKYDDSFSQTPDLILVDGGQSHVNVVKSVVKSFNLDIQVFGMVKDSKHNTRAISSSGGEVHISKLDDAFKLLVSIQDETHRFAITYAKSKHSKNSLNISLTSVKGIGEKKANQLMMHFKTTQNLKNASIEDLKSVAGVGDEIAKNLFDLIQNTL